MRECAASCIVSESHLATDSDQVCAGGGPVSRIMRLPGAGEAAIGICAPSRVDVQRAAERNECPSFEACIQPEICEKTRTCIWHEREEPSPILHNPEDTAR